MRLSQLSLMCVFAVATAQAQLPVPAQPAAPATEPAPAAAPEKPAEPAKAVAEPETGAVTALDRLVEASQQSSMWPLCRSQSDRMSVMRDKALTNSADASPVSDRYVITTLAGPVDMVRFFNMAKLVSRGSNRYQVLVREWEREGGPAYMARRTAPGTTDCRPDDLPSNALGALFGELIKAEERNLDFDLVPRLKKFFSKLEPVSDEIVKQFSHETLVLGLTPSSSRDEIRASRECFTAAPLYLIPVVAPERKVAIPNAIAALKTAGLELRRERGQLIVLEPVGAPMRASNVVEPTFPTQVLTPRTSAPQAVPVE
ncbi:hypothetical protein [Brevifollis gellanilyticus]|nr:hypothetical protein [Brevifollis gellanilyticus]